MSSTEAGSDPVLASCSTLHVQSRGCLEDGICPNVVLGTEFGRTPRINCNEGWECAWRYRVAAADTRPELRPQVGLIPLLPRPRSVPVCVLASLRPGPGSQAPTGCTKSSVNLDPATYMRMSNPPSFSVSSSGGTGLLIPYMTKMLWSSICTAVG